MDRAEKGIFREHGRNLAMLLLLGGLLLVLGVFSPGMSPSIISWSSPFKWAFVGIACLGTAYLIISGNIDLSVGSIFALTAVVGSHAGEIYPAVLGDVARRRPGRFARPDKWACWFGA